MPESIPELDGLAMGAYYEPGGSGVEVGGDWYDVLPLRDGRVVVALGDVMGKGVAAAIVMGQVRAALRAYALIDPEPGVVLSRLDALVTSLGIDEQIVTVAYGVTDPGRQRLSLALAGHPAPAAGAARESRPASSTCPPGPLSVSRPAAGRSPRSTCRRRRCCCSSATDSSRPATSSSTTGCASWRAGERHRAAAAPPTRAVRAAGRPDASARQRGRRDGARGHEHRRPRPATASAEFPADSSGLAAGPPGARGLAGRLGGRQGRGRDRGSCACPSW